MKDLQTQKRIKASAFGSAILALVALAFFAGCSVYLLDGSAASGDSYSASQIAGSYTGSSTLQSTFLAIMNNYTDTDWSKWLAEIGANTNGDLETQSVGTPVLTLSADGSFSMTVPYVSNYQANGELPVSGTWSVSGTTVTFTYGASIESWVNQTAPANLPGIIETLVNGAELWTDGSSLYGRFGYGNYWTDTSDELFTR